MRLMLVTTVLLVGGAENQVFLLASAFRRAGHEVSVVSVLEPEAYVPELEALGVKVHSLKVRNAIGALRGLVKLRSIIRSYKPELIHAHMFHGILLTRLANMGLATPVLVSTTHNFAPETSLRSLLYRATDRLGTITTNVSRAGTAKYLASGAAPVGRLIEFPNGILVPRLGNGYELRSKYRQELGLGDEFVWLAVGRLEKPKDYPTMLRAAQELGRLGSESKVLIVGDGNRRESILEKYAAMGEIQERVRFLGERRDVFSLMQAVDGYVMSSSSEGLPLVLLEASAARLPIVATDVGGNREIVSDGACGTLVPPGQPDALAKAMLEVESLTESSRSRLGANGRSHVEQRYEIEAVARRWLSAFEQWLQDA